MNRRHFASMALAATGALTATTAVASGVFTPTGAAGTQTKAEAASLALAPSASTSSSSWSWTLNPTLASQQARVVHSTRAANIRAMGQLASLRNKTDKAHQFGLYADLVRAHNGVQGPMWSCIRTAESGNRYGITSGAYGILISSWNAYASVWSPYGHWSVPGAAPAYIQDLVAFRLYEIGGGFGGWNDPCTGR
jgi:hypothetical protein